MRSSLTALVVIISVTQVLDLRADVRGEIRKLIPEASAMDQADFEKLARTARPRDVTIEEKSLTLTLLSIELSADTTVEQRQEFRFQQPARPDALYGEIYRIDSRTDDSVVLKGPVTFLSQDRITHVTAEVDGDLARGTVSFKAPELYEGTVQYTARRGTEGWRVTEWHLPAHGIRLVYDDTVDQWAREDDRPQDE